MEVLNEIEYVDNHSFKYGEKTISIQYILKWIDSNYKLSHSCLSYRFIIEYSPIEYQDTLKMRELCCEDCNRISALESRIKNNKKIFIEAINFFIERGLII